MNMKSYLILCAVLSAAWAVALLAIPGLSDYVEQVMLLFLSTNAR